MTPSTPSPTPEPEPTLAACPFCGGTAFYQNLTHKYKSDDPEIHHVRCKNGRCRGYASYSYLTKEEAISAWNTRATLHESADTKAYAFAFLNGWSVRKVFLYDEEGVEGWTWDSPSGQEISEIGVHDEPPPIPDALIAAMQNQEEGR